MSLRKKPPEGAGSGRSAWAGCPTDRPPSRNETLEKPGFGPKLSWGSSLSKRLTQTESILHFLLRFRDTWTIHTGFLPLGGFWHTDCTLSISVSFWHDCI